MKYLNILFLIIVIGCNSKPVNHSQTLVNLFPTKKWFEIENYYQQNKDSISEIIKIWYLAETGNAFNRPMEALDAYEQLIDSYQDKLKMDIPFFIHFIVNPLINLSYDMREFKKGEELFQKLITIIERDTVLDSDKRLSYIRSLTQNIENFKKASQKYSKMEITRNEVDTLEEIQLIPDISGNAIIFNAKWNGNVLKTFFDTGSSSGGVFKNRLLAEKMGVKIKTTDTIIINGNLRGLYGVMEKLEIGPFNIKNIPVTVHIDSIDHSDPIQVECDSITNLRFDIALGIPVIKQLGVVEFDFVKHTMSFPQQTKTFSKRNLYIEKGVLFMNLEICNANCLVFFDTGANGGLSINSDFYKKHRKQISIEEQSRQEFSQTGGCSKASMRYRNVFKCPLIDIKIIEQEIKIVKNCHVSKDKENDWKLGSIENSLLGHDIFPYCKKATFDFENMTFSVEK